MKCRVNECISGSEFFYVRGDVVDFDESTARAYQGMGVVEIIDEQQASAPAPTRTADKPGRKKSEN